MSFLTKEGLKAILPDAGDNEEDLPAIASDTLQRRDQTEEFQPLIPKVDLSKRVSRYRAGYIPEWAKNEAGADEEEDITFLPQHLKGTNVDMAAAAPAEQPRRRFQAKLIDQTDGVIFEAKRSPEKSSEDESSEDESADEIDARRQRIRARALEKQIALQDQVQNHLLDQSTPIMNQIELVQQDQNDREDEEKSESSEWETDTDDEDEDETKRMAMMKPIFVRKSHRGTIQEQEQKEHLEELREERRSNRMKSKKQESKVLVANELQREKEELELKEQTTDTDMPDDCDDIDPESEYKAWEIREMKRIIQDREQREKTRKELMETLRRRNLTEEERSKEDQDFRKGEEKDKAKYKFMQKYYHKGAFYLDEKSVQQDKDVRKRDYTDATLEDNFNKESMPAVMQVKNFGRSGQTKYTHLVDQDTSRDDMWSKDRRITERNQQKMSGIGQLDDNKKKRRL